MNELINTLQDIPPAALIPLIAALLVGLILWAAGRRVLRVSFMAIGLLIGLALGWLVGESFNVGLPAWSVGVIAGVVLAVVAVILYRAAVAATMAIILAVASPMAVVAMHEWQGQPVFVEVESEPPAEEVAPLERDEIDEWLGEKREEIVRERAGEYIPEEIAEQLGQIRTFGERLLAGLREAWASTTESVRPMLIGAAISGGLLGLILGGLLPGFSAAVITSFGGSLMWIAALRVLVVRVGWGDLGFLPTTGRSWLIFWLIAAVIGLAIQWTIGARRADK